ncbi:hypothetical protein [Brevundimonas sp.]|uniref:hypothetical protein n=1 Tax=Brevundimonas sp. TaxID=1871086 RepID=UPI002737F971|nr:hypothetical protein [Brevundimonas sp.]MDP3801274.1 hypothetical protein [Brevundimonas sp.]
MKSSILTLAATAVSILAAPAWAQDPQAPFPAQTGNNGARSFSGWVEDEMQAMVRSCTGSTGTLTLERRALPWRLVRRPATAIPVNLQQKLRLDQPQWVMVETDNSVSRIFATIFDRDPRTAPNPGRSYLVLDDGTGSVPVPLAGENLVAYQSDCNTSLSAALSQDSEFSIAVASLKNSLSAQYQASGVYRINLVRGHFQSPLGSVFHAPQPGPSEIAPLTAGTALWLWYYADPARRTRAHYMVSDFHGTALLQQATSDDETVFEGEASGGARVATIGASASVQGAIGRRNHLTSLVTAIAYDQNASGQRWNIIPLPSVETAAQIFADHARATFERGRSDSTELIDTSEVMLIHSFAGIPQALCAPRWEISEPGLRPSDVHFDVASRLCLFETVYTPTASMVANGGNLTFSFRWKFGATADGADLVLRTLPVPFTRLEAPAIQLEAGDPEPRVGDADSAGYSSLTWAKVYALTDPQLATRKVQRIVMEDLMILCDGRAPISVTESPAVIALDGQTRKVNLTLVAQIPYPVSAGAGTDRCQITGTVEYILQNNQRVTRAFPASNGYVYVPKMPAPRSGPEAAIT